MKSNGDPDRYAVYIQENWTRIVEVVATSEEEARKLASLRYNAKEYEDRPVMKDYTSDPQHWPIIRIEGCC